MEVQAQAGPEVGGDRFVADEPHGPVEGQCVEVPGDPQALLPGRAHGPNGVLDQSPGDTLTLPPWVNEQVATDLGAGLRLHVDVS